MRATVITGLAFLISLSAAAGTIEKIDPESLTAGSSEQFITIYGTELGDHVLYSGKAGEFDVEISARGDRSIVAYVPDEILNAPDRYTIYIRGDLGTIGPAYLGVLEASRPFVLLVPDPIAAPATSVSGAVVSYEVWPYGGSGSSPSVTCSSPSGSVFPLGPTTVNCTATNSVGETASGQVFIMVYDGGAPILKLPERVLAVAETRDGAFVKFDVSAYDEIDGALPVRCSRESGSLFPIGKTVVDCVATDAALNDASGSFEVVVENKGFLLLHLPDPITAEAESPTGTFVKYEVWADGTDDPNPSVKCDPQAGSEFPLGTTIVACFAADRFGNTAEGRFEVNVVDTAPPVFTTIYAKPELLDPSGELVPVTVVWDAVDVIDPAPRCTIAGVWANEDIAIDDFKILSETEVALRAVTNGENDRVYHVNVLCSDAAQNEAGANADVRVSASKPQSATIPPPAPSKRRSSRH